jgi:hypothetical protein
MKPLDACRAQAKAGAVKLRKNLGYAEELIDVLAAQAARP